MYCPSLFRESRLPSLHALMRAHPLAMMITAGDEGLMANLLPFTLCETGGYGTLRAHIAKGNTQLKALAAGSEVLVVFQGPESYIPPSWYPSKARHGKVVPTWNYAVVQARGTPRLIDDAVWLRAQVEALTASQEGARPEPWQVSDAPDTYVATLMHGIVGLEIPISRLEGKSKLSQNRNEEDRQGVQDGLRREGVNDEMVRMLARLPKPD
ncbi:FMN-binding negative transcriptional regulator [Paludibacterium yongneupense]|uniref:FMN-binding negative transcriptional regulator n=1 Tax=Paludibacterium yongneupense TaxID=400061 RepID=UPI0003F7E0F5|nr:FMN-binding negative transcriptional regulator [Paludibacterium yongneupense]